MKTNKSLGFAFETESLWILGFSLVPVVIGLLIAVVVLIVRWLR